MLNYWHFNKEDGVTAAYIGSTDFGQWMKQNQGEYTGEYVEGCLLDSFVVATKRGYAFFYEHFLNTGSSDYEMFFIPYKEAEKHNPNYDVLWSEWFEFEDKYREQEA